MNIASSAFRDGETIPQKFTAYGENVVPGLTFGGVPEGAQVLALILDDPDAVSNPPFTHWLLTDIPLSGDVSKGVTGTNSAGKTTYYGPRPPAGSGLHHYHFHVYALDARTGLAQGYSKADLVQAMEGHILAEGELVGTYQGD